MVSRCGNCVRTWKDPAGAPAAQTAFACVSMQEDQPGEKAPEEEAVNMHHDEQELIESRKHALTEWMQGVDDEDTRHAKRIRYG